MKNPLQTQSWNMSNDMMHADFDAPEETFHWDNLPSEADLVAELSDLEEEWDASEEWDTDFGGLF